MNIVTRLAVASTLMATTALTAQIHVDASSTHPTPDGLSWAKAYPSLAIAFSLNPTATEFWVADGVYKPRERTNPADPRSAAFLLQSVKVYGGFDGTETSLAARAGLFTQTVLEGDLGVAGSNADNAYHVVRWRFGVTLDGFVIQNGNANGVGDTQGGGLLLNTVSPGGTGGVLRLANVTFTDNEASGLGGAVYQMLGHVLAKECTFVGNSAAVGGGMFSQAGGFTLHNCTFLDNTAENGGAIAVRANGSPDSPLDEETGAMTTFEPNAQCVNTVFSGNQASANGGAIYLFASATMGGGSLIGNIHLINCTLAYNEAASGGGIYAVVPPSTPPAHSYQHNCIVYFNTAAVAPQLFGLHHTAFGDVEGGVLPGPGMISMDPLFTSVGTPLTLLSLLAGSPCLDLADSTFLPADIMDLDLDGNTTEKLPIDRAGRPRISNGALDMGAQERL